jgi:hypothetical protein
MTGVPGVSPAGELSGLSAAELAARLAEAYRVIGELTTQAGARSVRRHRPEPSQLAGFEGSGNV